MCCVVKDVVGILNEGLSFGVCMQRACMCSSGTPLPKFNRVWLEFSVYLTLAFSRCNNRLRNDDLQLLAVVRLIPHLSHHSLSTSLYTRCDLTVDYGFANALQAGAQCPTEINSRGRYFRLLFIGCGGGGCVTQRHLTPHLPLCGALPTQVLAGRLGASWVCNTQSSFVAGGGDSGGTCFHFVFYLS